MECMERLKKLNLFKVGVKGFPSSIKFLNNLYSINLHGCENFRSLPSSICKLKSIGSFDLSSCFWRSRWIEDLDLN